MIDRMIDHLDRHAISIDCGNECLVAVINSYQQLKRISGGNKIITEPANSAAIAILRNMDNILSGSLFCKCYENLNIALNILYSIGAVLFGELTAFAIASCGYLFNFVVVVGGNGERKVLTGSHKRIAEETFFRAVAIDISKNIAAVDVVYATISAVTGP